MSGHKIEKKIVSEMYQMKISKMTSKENFLKCLEKERSAIRVAFSNGKIKYLDQKVTEILNNLSLFIMYLVFSLMFSSHVIPTLP